MWQHVAKYDERHCEFPLRTLQAQKWHVYRVVARLVPPGCMLIPTVATMPRSPCWEGLDRTRVSHVHQIGFARKGG